MDESEIDERYEKLTKYFADTMHNKIKYYQKTNFTNMIRLLSSVYSPSELCSYFNDFSRWTDVKFESDMIDKLVKNKLLTGVNREIRNTLNKSWNDMDQYEKKLILNFFNIKPNYYIDDDFLINYGYMIYLSLNVDFGVLNIIKNYYLEHSEFHKNDCESKLSDYDLNSQKEFIMNLLTTEQKIKLSIRCELLDSKYPKNLSVSELQKLFINYKMIKNFKLNEKTKIFIAMNNSIEDVKKMVEEENNVGTKVVGETHV